MDIELFNSLKKFCISEEKIDSLIKSGELNQNINCIFYAYNKVLQNEKPYFGYTDREFISDDLRKYYTDDIHSAVKFGARMMFFERDSAYPTSIRSEYRIAFTDFYLIVYKANREAVKDEEGDTIRIENKQGYLYKDIDRYVIPLDIIDKMSIIETESRYVAPKQYEHKNEKKDVIKGAVVGGIIAGGAGAVVGAIANSGTETRTDGAGYTIQYYDLRIVIGDEIITLENLISVEKIGESIIHTYTSGNVLINNYLDNFKSSDEPMYPEEKRIDTLNLKMKFFLDGHADKKLDCVVSDLL